MALITFKSENPEFSYILVKNPASGLLAKEIRQGRAFGWFTPGSTQEYSVWFKDSDTEVSYKSHPDENFEHVNRTRYNSAMFVINAIAEFLGSALKKPAPQDQAGFKSEIIVNMMYLKDPRYLDIFGRYFEDYLIQHEEVAKNHYKIKFTTQKPFRNLLSFVNLFAMFNVLKNEESFVDISEGVIDKYMACLQNIDAPYFVRYVFKVNLLRGKASFQKYKSQLETSGRYQNLTFVAGNTSMGRRNEVMKELGKKNAVVDFGCGEGFYAKPIAPLLEGKAYYAIDKDLDVCEALKWRAEKNQIENISVFNGNMQEFLNIEDENFDPGDEPVDLLAVEVIEHMPEALAKASLMQAIECMNVQKLIVTTPNKSFNVHYFDEEESMRHDDHHFEFTMAEFTKFMTDVQQFASGSLGKPYLLACKGIGDLVDGEHSSLMATLTLTIPEVNEVSA